MLIVRHMGREFKADGNRLTFTPFGELDFINIGNGQNILNLSPDKDALLIQTAGYDYRLQQLDGTPEEHWVVVRQADSRGRRQDASYTTDEDTGDTSSKAP